MGSPALLTKAEWQRGRGQDVEREKLVKKILEERRRRERNTGKGRRASLSVTVRGQNV